jgi:hypothetical protein
MPHACLANLLVVLRIDISIPLNRDRFEQP